MSTDTERRQLVRPDATIAYWVSGPEKAPIVVLLHGATLDHHPWAAQVDDLAGRYRVVTPDLRGHGGSPLTGHFRFDDAVDDIAALLDEVDDGAPVVLGGLIPYGGCGVKGRWRGAGTARPPTPQRRFASLRDRLRRSLTRGSLPGLGRGRCGQGGGPARWTRPATLGSGPGVAGLCGSRAGCGAGKVASSVGPLGV
jgi:hypothetical protein